MRYRECHDRASQHRIEVRGLYGAFSRTLSGSTHLNQNPMLAACVRKRRSVISDLASQDNMYSSSFQGMSEINLGHAG